MKRWNSFKCRLNTWSCSVESAGCQQLFSQSSVRDAGRLIPHRGAGSWSEVRWRQTVTDHLNDLIHFSDPERQDADTTPEAAEVQRAAAGMKTHTYQTIYICLLFTEFYYIKKSITKFIINCSVFIHLRVIIPDYIKNKNNRNNCTMCNHDIFWGGNKSISSHKNTANIT